MVLTPPTLWNFIRTPFMIWKWIRNHTPLDLNRVSLISLDPQIVLSMTPLSYSKIILLTILMAWKWLILLNQTLQLMTIPCIIIHTWAYTKSHESNNCVSKWPSCMLIKLNYKCKIQHRLGKPNPMTINTIYFFTKCP